MTNLYSETWTSGSPTINIVLRYEQWREATTMNYKIQAEVKSVTGGKYFGYPIYLDVSLDGVKKIAKQVIKNASPSQWSSSYVFTSSTLPLSNKISGTTKLSFRLYSGLGSSRDETYSYDIAVDPAMSDFTVESRVLGEDIGFSITKHNDDFKHILKYSYENSTNELARLQTQTSFTWTANNNKTLAASNINSTIFPVTFILETYSDSQFSTKIGETTKTVNLELSKNIAAKISGIQIIDQEISGYTNLYFQNKSKCIIRATTNTSDAQGATIASVTTSLMGKSYSNISTSQTNVYDTDPILLRQSGSAPPISVTVKDSRGQTHTYSTTIKVLEYTNPQISITDVSLISGEIRITFSASVASVASSNPAFTNKMKIGLTGYNGDWSIDPDTYSIDNDTNFIKDESGFVTTIESATIKFTADATTNYTITLTCTDVLGSSASVTRTTASGLSGRVMSFYPQGKGIAFGKTAETAGYLETAWPIKVGGKKSNGQADTSKDITINTDGSITAPTINSVSLSENNFVVGGSTSGAWKQWTPEQVRENIGAANLSDVANQLNTTENNIRNSIPIMKRLYATGDLSGSSLTSAPSNPGVTDGTVLIKESENVNLAAGAYDFYLLNIKVSRGSGTSINPYDTVWIPKDMVTSSWSTANIWTINDYDDAKRFKAYHDSSNNLVLAAVSVNSGGAAQEAPIVYGLKMADTNGGTGDSNGSGGSTITDTYLSASSTNPVQNKVIYEALQGKASVTQFSDLETRVDDLPTNNTVTTAINSAISDRPTNSEMEAAINSAISDLPASTTITVDTALSTSSTNPVQNKVICAKVNSMQSEINTVITDMNEIFTQLGEFHTYVGTTIANSIIDGGSW